MDVVEIILKELRGRCRLASNLLCEQPTESYFAGINQEAHDTLRAVANILKYHGGGKYDV